MLLRLQHLHLTLTGNSNSIWVSFTFIYNYIAYTARCTADVAQQFQFISIKIVLATALVSSSCPEGNEPCRFVWSHCRPCCPTAYLALKRVSCPAPACSALHDISSHNYFSFLRHENEPKHIVQLLKCLPADPFCSTPTHSAAQHNARLKHLDAFHFPAASQLVRVGWLCCILFCQTWRILITLFVASCLLIILFYLPFVAFLFALASSAFVFPINSRMAFDTLGKFI